MATTDTGKFNKFLYLIGYQATRAKIKYDSGAGAWAASALLNVFICGKYGQNLKRFG